VRKAQKYYLIGSDSIWARVLSEVVKDQLHALQAELVGETFLGANAEDSRDDDAGRISWNEAVARIEKAAPDVVISSVDGHDNPAFYSHLRRAGITPDRIPVISFSLDEEEVSRLPAADVLGQYAAWNYLQSIDRDENREFVRKFQAKYGADRVVSDNIQIAYQSVLIWAQTVAEAETDDIEVINREILRQSHNAPEGIITIDADTRHGWRPFYLGRVRPDGQFEDVWSLRRSIRPIPYPASRTREEWDALIDGIMAQGLGRGPAPRDRNEATPARSPGSARAERSIRRDVILGDR
jgi:urea transport system substrate-binding protein